jgi:hypothetical protein
VSKNEERRIAEWDSACSHAIGSLNNVESLLTGWVLGYDRDKIEELTRPLWELLDADFPGPEKFHQEVA